MNVSAEANKKTVSLLKSPVFWAFFVSFIYWSCLAFTASMDIKFDATNFQREGKSLYENGFDYFLGHTGHDIAYPFLIATAHYISDFLGLPSHLLIQRWIQIGFLLATQFLLFKALSHLNIRRGVKAGVLLYFGFSPAIVNASCSSWSEIVSLPFALAIVLVSTYLWHHIRQEKVSRAVFCSILLAILFVCTALGREIYRHIIVVAFPLVLLLVALRFLFLSKRKSFLVAVVSVIVFSASYQLFMMPYQNAQAKYQKGDLFLSRGVAQLYGGTLVRSSDLSSKQIASFLAYVAGENVVKKFFGEEAFNFWYYQQYDHGPNLQRQLEDENRSPLEIKQIFYQRIVENILRNPIQYAFLTAAEGAKMLFWESTRIGFVIYPPWLEKIYSTTLFKNTLRLGVFLLTTASLLFSAWFLYRNRSFLYKEVHKSHNNTVIPLLFFGLFLILSNITLYAPFIIETRYAIPIAPIYLALIGFSAEMLCRYKGWGAK